MADGYNNYSVLDADIFTGVVLIMVILFVRKFEHNLPLFVCEQKKSQNDFCNVRKCI